MEGVLGHARALALTLLGATVGAAWWMSAWVEPALKQGFSLPGLVLGHAIVGAVAQRWLSANETAAVASAVLAGSLLAKAISTEADEEHLGQDPATLVFAVAVIGIAVLSALATHWLVGALRSALRRPAGGS